MMLDNEIITDVFEKLNIDDFCLPKHQKIFKAIKALWENDESIDIITVSEKLNAMRLADNIGGLEYISNIASDVPTTANTKYYTDIVKEKSQLRNIINIARDMALKAYRNEKVAKLVQDAGQDILDISTNEYQEIIPIGNVVDRAMVRINERYKNKGSLLGLSTGFKLLNDRTGGLMKKDTVVIAARPSMGKSSLAVGISKHVALHCQLPVLFFSLEMQKERIINRLFSDMCNIENNKFKTGEFIEDELERMKKTAPVLKRSKLIIDDTPSIGINEMMNKARKQKMKYGEIGLIVIDHLTEMYIPGRNERMEISANARGVRRMGKMIDCPVILLAQLHRGPDSRKNHRPRLSDLRETGVIEEVADIVAFIYRDEYYNKDTDKPGVAEIIISKCRDGETGVFELSWEGKYTRFTDYKKPWWERADEADSVKKSSLPYKDENDGGDYDNDELPF